MKLTINEYYDNQDGKYIATKYLIDGEEVSKEEYYDMLDAFDDVNQVDEVDPSEYCECRDCC